MKKTFTIKREEQVEIDIHFPMYLEINDYSWIALINESEYLKISLIERSLVSTEEPIYNAWISTVMDKIDISNFLGQWHGGKMKAIAPDEFENLYFKATKIIRKQFNLLDNGTLPE